MARALGKDDEEAFAKIYGWYWQPLLRQANRKLSRPEGTREIVQDLFVTRWSKRRTATIQQLDGYLFAVLKCKTIDSIRKQLVRYRHAPLQHARSRHRGNHSRRRPLARPLHGARDTGLQPPIGG